MSNKNIESIENVLKKLEGKAELCRYSHSKLQEKYKKFREWKEFFVILLSILSSLLIGFYYRQILQGELILSVIFIMPSIIIIIQALDNTVYHWTDRMAKHKAAVCIWGNWIRAADFLRKQIGQYPTDVANEKIENMQKEYIQCMNNTPQIPNEKFLGYKEEFREYLLKSKKIDTMTLEDIQQKKYAKK